MSKKDDELSCLDISAIKKYEEQDQYLPNKWVSTDMMLADQYIKEGK